MCRLFTRRRGPSRRRLTRKASTIRARLDGIREREAATTQTLQQNAPGRRGTGEGTTP